MKPEDRKAVTDIITSALAEAFSKKAVPIGYTKCQKCGVLIPQDAKQCPYCIIEENEPEIIEEVDELFD